MPPLNRMTTAREVWLWTEQEQEILAESIRRARREMARDGEIRQSLATPTTRATEQPSPTISTTNNVTWSNTQFTNTLAGNRFVLDDLSPLNVFESDEPQTPKKKSRDGKDFEKELKASYE